VASSDGDMLSVVSNLTDSESDDDFGRPSNSSAGSAATCNSGQSSKMVTWSGETGTTFIRPSKGPKSLIRPYIRPPWRPKALSSLIRLRWPCARALRNCPYQGLIRHYKVLPYKALMAL